MDEEHVRVFFTNLIGTYLSRHFWGIRSHSLISLWIFLIDSNYDSSYLTARPHFSALYRNEEDGIQDPSVAREVFRLLHLQTSHRDQVIHTKGARHLLRKVLRGQIRHQVHQVQQSESVIRSTKKSFGPPYETS